MLTARRAFGDRIRDARLAAGLSQERLGELVDADRKTIHRIEYAISDPPLTLLFRIARAVGVPLSELVSEDDCE
ncbi:helix-turn-helix transcriptional regulator [Streptomyces jumonjinensis]|uniref:helix-turn-helix transcriptional regulator n=1 Tax=Streptomyces jumonjinensis TaxID=1945 RepID=UPI002B21C3D6|nr:helix-turn-helix transcriptional regulator [Streptomyces jumonjinensis]